ncbi:MAG: O-antigen ligase family protein [Anaerolineae bacterium]|nr:O-antigen ligase family protein [Phycisphaerae bacterium]
MKDHLTNAAFVLLIALVIARALSLETLRDPFEITPGADTFPRTLTAAASVWMDWLACVPAALILLRRAFDGSHRLIGIRSFLPLFLLAIWAALSPIWASDKFAAVVGVSHFIAAVAIFWAAAQLVPDWSRLRIVAGVCFGLMLALVAYGLIYRFVELPDLRESIQKNWTQILAQRGWEPGSFMETQFRRKVMAGEMVGFNASPNSFAAMLVMLTVVSVGAMFQRLRDPESRGWGAMIGLSLPLFAIVLWFTQSRTAFLTPVLAAICFATLAIAGQLIARRRGIVFAVCIALVLLVAGSLIAYGVARGNLVHDSLTFRWRYWIGSARLFSAHPLLGLGWNNFGDAYVAVREAIASEEIKDPHNLFVRFATELGAVGLMLAIAWLIALWWEMTSPTANLIAERQVRSEHANAALKKLAWIATAGIVLNIIFSVDLTQDLSWVFLEVLKRSLYLALILIGLIVISFRSFVRQEIDDRPAQWLRRGILIALAIFLLHNFIDFSFFETGPMWIFMMLAGASIGITGDTSSPVRRRGIGLITTFVTILWIVAGMAIALPITVAESRAQIGDELLRAKKPGPAARELLSASESLPFSNGDYLYRAARAQTFDSAPGEQIRRTINAAIAANPNSPAYYAFLARLEASQSPMEMTGVIAAFDKSLAMDPSDVLSRLLYAQVLERAGRKPEARAQYEAALDKDAQLDANEPKRLNQAKIDEIKSRIDRLK